ncbi:IF2 family translation initiation factor [Mycobacterium sp. 29Ha]|uniref:IF2 family translation initiation factor n=1 Tax=Mycobacterium sp. 29Ha TaxID=2939268 RepID=UPI002938F5B3|nr:IF2 family translation initiation factor [Mycobacterium sp. 29Ha]MDV3135835.1 IF2 family translation initiation factor [Mycobacterium sp. 29Ha]
MRIIDAPLAVLRVQYRIARFPLQLIEQRVVARMDAEAPARLFYERSLGLLDASIGNVLGDRQLQRSGSALARRSDVLGRAAQLDSEAEQAQQRSRADLKAKSDEASQERHDARVAKEQTVEEARNSAQERKRAAEEAAAQRTAAAKKQADDVAAQRTKSAEAAKRMEHAKISPTNNGPPRPRSQSSTMLRPGAQRPGPSGHRRIASRIWPTPRSASVKPPGRTTSKFELVVVKGLSLYR